MELTESYTLPVSQQHAWEALNDTTILRASIPGCDRIEVEQENVFALSMSVTVGPVKVHFKGRLRLTDIDAPRSYTIVFEGQGGTAGFGSGAAHITLESVGDDTTKLSYTASAHMGGKLAQIGSRILGGAVRKIVGEFFRRFGGQVSGTRTASVADATANAAAQLHHSANRSADGGQLEEPQPERKKSWTASTSKS